MKLPALTLTTLQGESIDLHGTPPVARLLIVYRHDCATCALVLPALERLSRSLHGRNLLTLGVSQSTPDDTLDAINDHGLCFPQAIDEGLALSRDLALERVPAILLVGPSGEVVDRTEGLDLAALTRVAHAAARLCGVEEATVDRALAPFGLPPSQPGRASRTLDPETSGGHGVNG